MKWLERLPNLFMHAAFLLLILLSVVLYKERLFADAAYYFFHSINSGWFHIEADRIAIALSQVFPLTAYWLGFPLKYLMVISSVGHELFFYGLFLLLLYKFKNQAAAIALLLIHLIGQLWLFYMPFLEISYGAALAIVFYGIINSDKWRDDKWLIILLVIEWFVLFSHPENLFLIPVILVFDYLNRGLIKPIHFPALGVFITALAVKILNFSQYDQQKLGSSMKKVDDPISSTQYMSEALEVYANYYPEILFFVGITLAYLIYKKAWLKAAYVVASLGVLIFIINKIESTNTFYWYAEVVNYPVVFLSIFFFMFWVLDPIKGKVKQLIKLLLFATIIIRFIWIWSYGEPLRQRTAQLERIVDYAQMLGHSKYIVESANYDKSYSMVTWANPIEALLFSALDGKDQTVSIINEKDFNYQKNKSELNPSNFLFRKFDVEPSTFLNPKLFQVDQENYHRLNNADFSMPYKEMANSIAIEPFHSATVGPLNANDSVYFLVRIKNGSEVAIPSALSEQLFLSYHWIKEGKDYQWDGIRTPLEVDVFNEYSQDILIQTPSEKGIYEIQLDIVMEGKDWFGLEEKYQVIIY